MASKEYHRQYNLRRYHARRATALEKLGGVCRSCGATDSLEFDHVNPKTKSFDSKRWMSVSLSVFWGEVDKCQLLCVTCHLEKTLAESGRVSAKREHGTLSAYRYCGPPKCELCKAARREYLRKYRACQGSIVGDAPDL